MRHPRESGDPVNNLAWIPCQAGNDELFLQSFCINALFWGIKMSGIKNL
jgi:hypothetical protein